MMISWTFWIFITNYIHIEMDEHRREMHFKCLWHFLTRGVLTVYLNLVADLNVALEYI